MGLDNPHTWHAQSQHHCEKKKPRKITVVWWVQKPDNPTPANRTPNENWLGNVSAETDAGRSTLFRPWQTSPQLRTRRSTHTGTHSVERLSGTDSNLSRTQNTEGKGRRTQIKERGDKGEISEQGSSFLGISYWTDGSSEELSWHCWKPTDAECDGVPLSVCPDLTCALPYLL